MKNCRPTLILLIVQKQAQSGICACFSTKMLRIYAQPLLNPVLLRSQKTGEKTGHLIGSPFSLSAGTATWSQGACLRCKSA
jgi:hypothetical protein